MLDFGFYNMDCMEGMKQFPDKYFDLAIVDPPYGLGDSVVNSGGRFAKYHHDAGNWDKEKPPAEYFIELKRVSKYQIIWGGNYFGLEPTKCFIIWDKKQPQNISFASCEYAWTNFDKVAKTFYYSPMQEKWRFHPTQKPVALYKWLLTNYAKEGYKILDTHVGSASSLIACYDLGFDYVGFEIDEEYYRQATKRLEEEKAQVRWTW